MKVVSVAQMREAEEATFAAGTTEAELQGRAGRAVADAVAVVRPGPGSVVALVGPGNNGRDAWIAVAELLRRGWRAKLYLTLRHAIGQDELERFVADGGRVVHYAQVHEPDTSGSATTGNAEFGIAAELQGSDVLIDGLLGIGTSGPPRPPLDAVVRDVNALRGRPDRPFVVAVDNPSGVDADTGVTPGVAVRADATVVLGGAKQGLLTAHAAAYTGRLIFADIGVVPGLASAPELVDNTSLQGLLTRPPADAHKYTFGRVLVVAGSERYVGAAYLAAAAAIRAGTGVVTLAAPRWLRDVVAARLAEVTYLPIPDAGLAGAPDESVARIVAELDGFSALAIGPGLSLEGGVGNAVEAILRERARRNRPAVVDADALNALSQRPDWPTWIGKEVVLTPHAGELERLVASDAADSGADAEAGDDQPQWLRARTLAERWGVTLLMKGPFTTIASGDQVWIHARPNPALATAGTGDVLTGIIAGLLARGLPPSAAARLGTWVHGQAGARIAADRPAGGLMASELLTEIPLALAAALDPRGAAD